jgi:hypothetical protein
MKITKYLQVLVGALLFIAVPGYATAQVDNTNVILYDGSNCTGEYRALWLAEGDFNAIGFDNRVNSVHVYAGIWRFHRDAGFGNGNGPPFELSAGTGCTNVEQFTGGTFPNNLMSAAQPLSATPGTPPPIIHLYDFAGFGGEYRVLTASEPDFNAIGFDNDVESIEVINGQWTLYRNSNYGAPPDRPSITLGPGSYPNVASVPGYPPNHFPGDLMSSAQAQIAPEPEPLECPSPYMAPSNDGTYCAFYCNPNSWPNTQTLECDCGPGYEQVGVDAQGRRICEVAQQPEQPPNCPPPYQYLDSSVNPPACAWNCHQSTQPDPASGQCVCLPGTVEAGFLNDGRRYCLADPATQQPPPAREVIHTVPADQAIAYAMQRGWSFSAQPSVAQATCLVAVNQVILMPNPALGGQPLACTATMFANGQLAPGWRFASYDARALIGQYAPTGLTAQLPFQLQIRVPTSLQQGIAVIDTLTLYGPEGADWREAF